MWNTEPHFQPSKWFVEPTVGCIRTDSSTFAVPSSVNAPVPGRHADVRQWPVKAHVTLEVSQQNIVRRTASRTETIGSHDLFDKISNFTLF